ncbi:MAG: SagB/ThcOx family dehydrogenase [Gammaproteobacteria bacterium]|nr:SagB/ThcOx family dehydrogenase [Gammaproteobacteria bacterium]
MTKLHKKQNNPADLDLVYKYHDQTKHHLHQYARSLGYMDWASQPNPFRNYEKTLMLPLDHPPVTEIPTYDSLFSRPPRQSAQINRESISHLFYESLAISAWKQAGDSRWSLRVNPSSGDLHPTEAYFIAGPIDDLNDAPAVFHYSPYKHALEHRVTLRNEEWCEISRNMMADLLLVALTSIYWRESWKYGERAYRYCHHDVGHAIAAVTFAAATLGWQTKLIHSISDDELATLLGLHDQEGVEAEHPDCLLALFPADKKDSMAESIELPPAVIARLKNCQFAGSPNTLSNSHHEWSIIDTVAATCRADRGYSLDTQHNQTIEKKPKNTLTKDRLISARRIIRGRRSAVSMDGSTSITKETFYTMMGHVTPTSKNNITEVLFWPAQISLAIFVHRVEGLPTGLYLLVRDPDHEPSLRKTLRPEFHWLKPADCPDSIRLYLLAEVDARNTARVVCCHQNIAADGAFALGMLAAFDASLEQYGTPFYPRLFWETGLIGQILYLEAEAAGIRSTGIGCFFDDAMHDVLGIHDHSWQSLYHFTVGGPVEDPRIQTLPSYWYLKSHPS